MSPQEMASHGPNPVLRYDGATGTFIDIFVAAGSGEIRNPTALTFGRDGKGTFLDTFVPQGMG